MPETFLYLQFTNVTIRADGSDGPVLLLNDQNSLVIIIYVSINKPSKRLK